MGKFVGLIPFRKGSKRVPDKNIRKIKGIPLFEYSLMVAKMTLPKVIVATDYTKEELLNAGPSSIEAAEVVYYQRQEVEDTQIANYYIKEQIECGNIQLDDYVVLLQPTCPLRTLDHIWEATHLMIANSYDALISCIELDSINKMYCQNDDKLWRNLSVMQDYDRFKAKPIMYRNSSIYIFSARYFMEHGNIWGDTRIMYPMGLQYSIDIDSEEDFQTASQLITMGLLDRR